MLLAGATGLVGSRVLALLPAAIAVGRRATGRVGEIVAPFTALPALPPAATAVCALGTTMAMAGSEAAFRAADQDAVLAFAAAAGMAGVRQFIVVTAVGADPASRVFYSRVKGEVEQALALSGFARLDIIRPGLIIGPRAERRPVEALLQRIAPVVDPLLIGGLDRYGSVSAETVAHAIAALIGRPEAGIFRHHNRDLHRLAD